jgi:hypothetical protein
MIPTLSSNSLRDLDLFHDGTNYTTSSGASFDDLEAALVEGVFGFCGCGQPEKFLELVGDVLRLMVDYREYLDGIESIDKDPGWQAVWTKYHDDMESRCGNAGSVMLLQYLFDKTDMTEHGGSVCSAWPASKGYAMLEAIEMLEEE